MPQEAVPSLNTSSSAIEHGSSLPRGIVADRYGFIIDAEKKAAEDEYIRRHPEMPVTQKRWAMVLERWDRTSHGVKKELCRQGMPQSMRHILWPMFLSDGFTPGFSRKEYHVWKLSPPADPEVFAVIERDLGRTFPTHQWFLKSDGFGQSKLRLVLRAYANVDPEVGYVQGMAFLAATLLLQIKDEESTFWAFLALMRNPKYSMANIFAPGFPGLYLRFFQLKKLMEHKCKPLLHRLEKFHIDPFTFATQWFLTLFSYELEFDVTSRIWDIFIFEGWKIIFRVAITFFLENGKTLKKAKDEADFILALRKIHEVKSTSLIIAHALDVRFKTSDLVRWEKKYKSQS